MTPVLLNAAASRPLTPSGVFRIVRYIVAPEKAHEWQRLDIPPLSVERRGPLQIVRFPLPSLFESMPGRVAFFSDLHWNLRRRPLAADTLVDAVNSLSPAWIVFGGDLVHALDALPEALEILGALRADAGKVAVLGNWEMRHQWVPVGRWRDWFAEAGFHLLTSEHPQYDPGGAGPVFRYAPAAGAGDGQVPRGPAGTIAVAHSPDTVVVQARRLGAVFCLAGHTHGGQIRLPLAGPLYASSRFGVRFAHGWYENGATRTRLYVTAGVGCTGRDLVARRIGCPPEIACFDPPETSARTVEGADAGDRGVYL